MIKKVILAAVLASIVGLGVFYLVADLLGNQMLLHGQYCCSGRLWRHPNLLSRDMHRILKYFLAFFLTNSLWAYVFSMRQNAFDGSGIAKGIKFFFLVWLLTLPIHFWSWILIAYPKKILLYNVFVYYFTLFMASGVVIGKVCSES